MFSSNCSASGHEVYNYIIKFPSHKIREQQILIKVNNKKYLWGYLRRFWRFVCLWLVCRSFVCLSFIAVRSSAVRSFAVFFRLSFVRSSFVLRSFVRSSFSCRLFVFVRRSFVFVRCSFIRLSCASLPRREDYEQKRLNREAYVLAKTGITLGLPYRHAIVNSFISLIHTLIQETHQVMGALTRLSRMRFSGEGFSLICA